jgi:hypothetical protein
MPTVEGFTPEIAWTTLYGFFALCLLFLIGFRVYDAFHTIIERRRQRKESEKPDFAKKVSKQVITEIGPRLDDIEENLRKDKARLEAHERLIENIERGQSDVHDGLTAIAKFMLVISTYGNIGNNEKVKEASADLQKFLAERL